MSTVIACAENLLMWAGALLAVLMLLTWLMLVALVLTDTALQVWKARR